jgi:hypothetical protein
MPAVRPLAPRAGPALMALYVLAGSALLGIGTDVRRIVIIGQYLDARAELDSALQADDLVALASFVGLAAAVAAVVLAGRWLAALRAGRAVLGPALGGLGAVRAWLALAAAAFIAAFVTRVALSATSPQEVRDADVLDAGGQVLVLLAAVVGIVVVNRMTERHDGAAAAAGVLAAPAPRRLVRGQRRAADPGEEGGLRVVSEEEVRGAREPGGREPGARESRGREPGSGNPSGHGAP